MQEEGPSVDSGDAAVYVHFPYCVRKCPYCDFNSHVAAHDDVAYADAILRELDRRGDELTPTKGGLSSVYFGGGTPSLWAPAEVGRVLHALVGRFGARDQLEVTLEANPGSVALERLEAFRTAGINRFSIGAQSFSNAELQTLERIHDDETGRRAVLAAAETGARVSLDLIYGLPGQTPEDAQASVETALGLQPDHISAYTLTLEPNTVLERRARLGTFRPMPEDDQVQLIEAVTERLREGGFERYEVSSYAPRGSESRHNTLYWVGGAYLGLGAGAHSYVLSTDRSSARRVENERSPTRYIEATRGASPLEGLHLSEDRLSRRGIAADRLMLVFRTTFGLDVRGFARELGLSDGQERTLVRHLERLERQGFLGHRSERWTPSERGLLFNDAVARAMLAAADAIFDEPTRFIGK